MAFCELCAGKKKREELIDLVCASSYKEDGDLDNDPITVLPCNRFFLRSSMDMIMVTGKVYCLGSAGCALDIPRACPISNTIEYGIYRYGSVQKRARRCSNTNWTRNMRHKWYFGSSRI